jgi:hypothetical protein
MLSRIGGFALEQKASGPTFTQWFGGNGPLQRRVVVILVSLLRSILLLFESRARRELFHSNTCYRTGGVTCQLK